MEEIAELPGLYYGLSIAAIRCEVSTLGSADCALICRCDDGSDYAIKDQAKNAAMPHSEWFCTRLVEEAGIAAPTCRVVDVEGEKCFGSRWETGHNPKDWWLRALAKEIDFALLAPTISRIFAFDLFVNNDDRHLNNYIVREQHFGIAMLSFDFSRSWLCNGVPPPDLPMAGSTNTMMAIRFLLKEFGKFIIIEECNTVLDNLYFIGVEKVDDIIDEHPNEWLTNEQKDAVRNWWISPERLDRIAKIKEGIGNGTYL